MASRWRLVWFIGLVISLVIGLSTLLTGCNTSIRGGCIGYSAEEGTILRYRITEDKCQRCGGGVCSSESCFNGYAIAQYARNRTCNVQGASREKTPGKAEQKTKKTFQFGETYDMYLRDGSNSCFVVNKLYSLWLTGVICLCIGSLLFLALLVDNVSDYQIRRRSVGSTIVPQQELSGPRQNLPSAFDTPPSSTASEALTDPGEEAVTDSS
jgi:hypothetical protein